MARPKGQLVTLEHPGKSRLMHFIKDHLDYQHDYCLIWPFGRHKTGYGAIGCGGKNLMAHRLICEAIHGAPPTPKHHAAHSCGQGDKGCVNPRHISWKTNSENQLDRRKTETGRRPRRKLTAAQILEIRELRGRELISEVAKRYGVKDSTIRQVYSGRTWGWVKDAA